MGDAIRFIHKDGRVIPIAAAGVAGAARASSHAGKAIKAARGANAVAHASGKIKKQKTPKIKENKALDYAGLGLSILSGAVAAATFSHGAKGLVGGAAASHALDAVGVGANVAAVAGKGHTKERAKLAARNEARNFIVGNAVYAAGIVGSSANRKAAIGYSQKIISFAKKALRVL